MGRRKIEMEYLVDDRVRKVTFCKRKGGLFKKADDLSKLCGVEIAVVIVAGENKTCEFASTDMDRILTKYKDINAGQAPATQDDITERLWAQLESQRREIEGLQRELLEEHKKVEALAGADVQICAVQPAQAVAANVTALPTLPMIHTMSTASLPSDSAPPSVPPPPGAFAMVAALVQQASTQPRAAACASPDTVASGGLSTSAGMTSEVTRPRDEAVIARLLPGPDAKRARVEVAEMMTKVIEPIASPKNHTLQSY